MLLLCLKLIHALPFIPQLIVVRNSWLNTNPLPSPYFSYDAPTLSTVAPFGVTGGGTTITITGTSVSS